MVPSTLQGPRLDPERHAVTLDSCGFALAHMAQQAGGGEPVCTLRGHSAAVNCVAYSPDGKHIVSASGDYRRDNTVRIWDAASGKEVGATGPCHARYQFSLTVAVGRSAR